MNISQKQRQQKQNKLRLHRTKKLLHNKGNNPQNENTICGMGDNKAYHVSFEWLICNIEKYSILKLSSKATKAKQIETTQN